VAEAIRQETDPDAVARLLTDAERRFLQGKQGKA